MTGAPGTARASGVVGAALLAATSFRLAWESELQRRWNFLLQLLFMVVNDITWVVFWLLVFTHRHSIRGWSQDDVLTLFAVLTYAFGVGIGLLYGCRRLGRWIRDGTLDPWLAQPRPVLVRVLTGRISPPLLGDLVFGPVLYLLTGTATVEGMARLLVLGTLGGLIVTAFVLATESVTFWVGGDGEFASVAFTALTIMASYPATIFAGVAKFLVFTIVPAAFVATVPAELIIDPSWGQLGQLLLVVAVTWTIAVATFQRGLRRYVRGG